MFKNIAPDKWKHFYVGILMGVALQAAGCWLLPENILLSVIIVFTLIALVSYGFELFSLFTGLGHYEFMDAVASIIGGALGIIIVLLSFYYISSFN